MTSCFLMGYSRLLVSTRASCITSVVLCSRWSLKSSMGLICTQKHFVGFVRGQIFDVCSVFEFDCADLFCQ